MDKFMGWLSGKIGGYFQVWQNLVKLPTTQHVVAGKAFSVNWSMVALVVCFWISLVVIDFLVFWK
jgi:hypothetical protein